MADNSTKPTYDKLNVTDKVRINAVVLAAFEGNQHDFVKKFRNQLKSVVSNDDARRGEGFQIVLDSLREYLAKDVKNIPQVKKNGIADTADLGAQMVVLRNGLKEVMAQETSRFENKPDAISRIVRDRKHYVHENQRFDLPELEQPYSGSKDMLLKASLQPLCKETKGKISCQTSSAEVSAPIAPSAQTGRSLA